MMENTGYEMSSNYTAPQLLSGVAKFLSFARFSGSTDFADLVSPNMNEQKNYTYGMVILITVMVTILFLWASILVVLKYHGDTGCAAGRPFQTTWNESTVRTSVSDPSTQNETFDSSSHESKAHDVENGAAQSSKRPRQDPVKAAKNRQRRTRIVFVTFGVIVLACTVLLLLFSFSPFRNTVDSSEEVIMTSQDIINQVKSSVRAVESAVEYANETLSQTPLDMQTVCPNFVSEEEMGVNLKELTVMMREAFKLLGSVGTENIVKVNQTLKTVQSALNRVRATVDTTDEKMWIFPLVLLIVFITGTGMLVGATLSWTGKSSSSVERKMAYIFLPIFFTMAAVCWLLALGAAIASLVTSDACVDPSATVQAILEEYSINMNTTTAKLITMYTNGCQGEDPTELFTEIEERLQTSIDYIWQTISIADSIGRDDLSLTCGSDVGGLLNGARDLARSLTWTRKALISAVESIQCGPINAIYVDAVHHSFCTEGGEGIAWAFILFSIVGIGAMVMVSLRASLYNQITEEEVYDERDEADNMILNEHEEYLAYISKYRHEWEEYRGLNAAEAFEPQLSGEDSVESIVASESWTERGSRDDTGIEADSWDVDSDGPPLTETDSEHEYGSIESCPTEDISFPSLHESQRPSSVPTGCNSQPIPSILGPPPGEEYESWDQEPGFFLGDKNTRVIIPPASENESEEPNIEVHIYPEGALDRTNMTAQKPDPPVEDNDRNAKNTHTLVVDTTRRDDPPVEEVDFYGSLHYVESEESDWFSSSSDKVRDTTAAVENDVTVLLTEIEAAKSEESDGIFNNVAKYFAAPEILGHLKTFGETLRQASPRMMKKFEI